MPRTVARLGNVAKRQEQRINDLQRSLKPCSLIQPDREHPQAGLDLGKTEDEKKDMEESLLNRRLPNALS